MNYVLQTKHRPPPPNPLTLRSSSGGIRDSLANSSDSGDGGISCFWESAIGLVGRTVAQWGGGYSVGRIALIVGVAPVISLVTTVTCYTNASIGIVPNGSGVRYGAGIFGWHTPALQREHY